MTWLAIYGGLYLAVTVLILRFMGFAKERDEVTTTYLATDTDMVSIDDLTDEGIRQWMSA